MSNLRVFGCICFFHVPDELRTKLDAKSKKAIFVGYPKDSKGYKLYCLATNRFTTSRNVSFFEDRFHDFGTKDDKELTFPEGLNDLTETLIHPPQVDLDGALEEEGRTEPVGVTYEDRFLEEVNNLGTKRNRRPPDRYQPDGCFITESLITDLDEPKSLDEALNSQHSEQWKAALQSEYDSLIEN